jgi:hypothetical protein
MSKRKNLEYTTPSSPPERAKHLYAQTTKPTLLVGVLAMLPGLFLLSIGLGLIHPTGAANAPMFVVTAIGAAFFFAGVSVTLQSIGLNPRSWLNHVLGLLIMGGMITPIVWMAFFNSAVSGFTKVFFGFILFFVLFIFALVAFARFIPGVRVIESGDGQTFKSISKSDDKL